MINMLAASYDPGKRALPSSPPRRARLAGNATTRTGRLRLVTIRPMTTSEVLERPTQEVAGGAIEYSDSGSGPPVVLLHGLLVNGLLWRKVVPRLEADYRLIVPELPFGAHRLPMNADAALAPPDVARLVAEFLEALDLTDVTLVGNDTGGAIAQLVAAHHPERLGRLVLTPCDAYDNFLPAMFKPLQVLARAPGLITAVFQPMRMRPLQHSPLAFGWLMKRPDRDVVDGWVRAFLADRAVRCDAQKVLRGISKRQTLEAAERLRSFERPVLLAWASEDRFFKFKYAERLAADIPGARLERIEDSYTFVPEDQPERTAELIARFASEES
jgi:pimeloyl-ACP methyl ester carboxylesterase